MGFFREVAIKATRKPHTCFWCGEDIEIGHPATFTAWTFDGDLWSWHWHPECRDAHLASARNEDGWCPGQQKRGVAYNEYGDAIAQVPA